MLSLATAPIGTIHQVKWITCEQMISEFLEEYGLIQGKDVQVVSSAKGSVIVAVGENRLAMGRDLAERIKV